MPGDYSEELVELLTRALWARANGRRLRADEPSPGRGTMFWFQARAVLNALAAAGRLVPEGSEVREEWGVIVHGRYGDLWDGCGDRKSAEREVESKRVRTFPREVGTRKVIWTPPIPWTPTEPEEAPNA